MIGRSARCAADCLFFASIHFASSEKNLTRAREILRTETGPTHRTVRWILAESVSAAHACATAIGRCSRNVVAARVGFLTVASSGTLSNRSFSLMTSLVALHHLRLRPAHKIAIPFQKSQSC